MAHWKNSAVTDGGTELLNEWMAGRKLTVTSVYGGTGTVDPETLREQTGLVEQKQVLVLMGKENAKDGVTVQVQVNNQGLEEEYELNQIAVYAALDRDRDPDSPESLLFIMQDEKGVFVPDESDEVFILELFCAIGITNNGRFVVTVDATGLVTMGRMTDAIAAAITAHNEDPDAHGGAICGASVTTAEVTIPATGWTLNTDPVEVDGLLHVDVEIEGIQESMIPWLAIVGTESRETAKLCGFVNEPRTLDGILRVYAAREPAAEMTASLALLGASIGSIVGGAAKLGAGLTTKNGKLTLDFATRTDVNGMFDGGTS